MPSVAGYVKKAQEQEVPISQVILEEQARELEQPREVLEEKMRQMLQVMQESTREGENPKLRSHSGLTGGAAAKVMERARRGESLCGSYFGKQWLGRWPCRSATPAWAESSLPLLLVPAEFCRLPCSPLWKRRNCRKKKR